MLRGNAHTTWRVREIMRRWRTEAGLTARSPMATLDGIDTADVDRLAVRIFRWLVNRAAGYRPASRSLPWPAMTWVSSPNMWTAPLGGFAVTAERRGQRIALYRAAAHGGLARPHWWGTPTWPELVRTFVQTLDDPSHSYWGPDGSHRSQLPPEPAQAAAHVGLP